MKIAFLTNKSTHGVQLLKALKDVSVLDQIIVEEGANSRDLTGLGNRLKSLLRKILPESLLALQRRLRGIPQTTANLRLYRQFCKNVSVVHNFNHPDCEKILRAMNPDLIILGGSRILRENILEIPSIGVLNAHPGLLPQYRGVDVIRWAIFNRDPVGVTIHFVDKGVDTGRICRQMELKIEKGDSIQNLRQKAESLAGQLLRETVVAIAKNREIETLPNPRESGKQYYRMDEKTSERVDQMLTEISNQT